MVKRKRKLGRAAKREGGFGEEKNNHEEGKAECFISRAGERKKKQEEGEESQKGG